MKDCQKIKKELVAHLSGELETSDKERVDLHLNRCVSCRQELLQLEQIKEGSEFFKKEIAETSATIDWDLFSEEMAGRLFKQETEGARGKPSFIGHLFQRRWQPLYAGLLAGLIIGSLVTYFLLRTPPSKEALRSDLVLTNDFFEKAELELARRETLEYLEKSQFLLLDFMQSPEGETADLWQDEKGLERARELLSKKKFINPQLDNLRLARAKEICDQIEFLFYELTQLRDHLSPQDKKRLQVLIEEKQLILRIKLVKNELKNSEV